MWWKNMKVTFSFPPHFLNSSLSLSLFVVFVLLFSQMRLIIGGVILVILGIIVGVIAFMVKQNKK
jgi:hypothetical protein